MCNCQNNLGEANIDKEKKRRFFIPDHIVFKKEQRDLFPGQFKLMKTSYGDRKLYMSPQFYQLLDSFTRGRSTMQKNISKEKTDALYKLPQDVKGALKKYIGKINSSIGMYPVNLVIDDVTEDGDIKFINPNNPNIGDLAKDNMISENKKMSNKIIKQLIREVIEDRIEKINSASQIAASKAKINTLEKDIQEAKQIKQQLGNLVSLKKYVAPEILRDLISDIENTIKTLEDEKKSSSSEKSPKDKAKPTKKVEKNEK